MARPTVDIYDIMACDVYWDFEHSEWPREQHKFLVSFYPTEDTPTPDLIDRIIVLGPDGYQNEISNQRFTAANRDGWIYDGALNYYWYMLNVTTGYLAEGEYTIVVVLRTGEMLSQSRIQQGMAGAVMVPLYEENREKIRSSFVPSRTNPLPADASLGAIRSTWSTLSDVGGLDAYYVYRLAEGRSGRDFDTQHLVWWDNIFIQRARGTSDQAGLNRGAVTVGTPLRPSTSYVYFVEITDANVQSEANICIFQPHQVFTTP